MKLNPSTIKQLIKEEVLSLDEGFMGGLEKARQHISDIKGEYESGEGGEEEPAEGETSEEQLNMLLDDLPSWLKDHGITTHSMEERIELLNDLVGQLEDNEGDAAADF